FHLFFLYPPRHPRSLPSFPTRRSSDLPETGNGIPAKHMKIMKTKERIRKIADSRWARTLALAVTAAIIFSWLYSHGISPVWTAVAIICFRGLFRFLYRIACFLVALAIILCILSFRVFSNLTIWNMHGIYHCSIKELSGNGRLFLYPSQPEMTREEKGMD